MVIGLARYKSNRTRATLYDMERGGGVDRAKGLDYDLCPRKEPLHRGVDAINSLIAHGNPGRKGASVTQWMQIGTTRAISDYRSPLCRCCSSACTHSGTSGSPANAAPRLPAVSAQRWIQVMP